MKKKLVVLKLWVPDKQNSHLEPVEMQIPRAHHRLTEVTASISNAQRTGMHI